MENTKVLTEIVGDDFNEKAQIRAIDAARVASVARAAAKKAEANGDNSLADKLNAEAEELEQAAANWNADTISNTSKQSTNGGAPKDKQEDENGDPLNSTEQENSPEGDKTTPSSQEKEGESEEEQEGSSESENNKENTNKKDNKDNGNPLDAKNTEDGKSSQKQSSSSDSKNSQSQTSKSDENSDGEGADESDSADGDGGDEGDDGEDSDNTSNSDNENEEEDDDLQDDEADPIKDIFGMTKPRGGVFGKSTQKNPRDPTIEEIKKMLNRLHGEARRGAIEGLQDLIKSQPRVESLNEAFGGKGLRELTDDEFAAGINSVLDLVDQVEKPDYVDPEEKKKRVGKILKLAGDAMANRELEREDNIYIRQDYQKKKARDKEAAKYTNYKTMDDFKINFFRSIKNQVEKVEDEEETYNRINAPFEDDGLIRPGERIDDVPGDIPSVDLYFDMSGSWYDDRYAIRMGKEAVATINEFAEKGEIKLNVYYFSNTITTSATDSCLNRGTGAWNDIIQNIKANHTKNVVLMTDTDMDTDADSSGVCKVDGEVWIIWRLDDYYYKNGSKIIPQHLIGKRGNHQYAFKSKN